MRLALLLELALFVMIAGYAGGCAQPLDRGFWVEEVDATFGLAYGKRDGGSAEPEPTAASGTAEDALDEAEGEAPSTTRGGDEGEPDASVSAPASASAVDAGPAPRSCRNVADFTATATPHLIERCVRCHDGTKSKATKALDLTSARDPSPAAQQRACDGMLRSAPDTSDKSPIFAEVNPSDSATVHDFKYPSSMAYMTYRDAVLAWLEGE